MVRNVSGQQSFSTSMLFEPQLTHAVEREIAEVIERTFTNSDFAGRTFFQQRHHMRVIARNGKGELVAHMAVLHRMIRYGDKLLDIFGIAEVGTLHEFRRMGVASALLDETISIARNGGRDAVMLFGTEKLYAKAGFKSVANPIRYVALDGFRTGDTIERTEHALMVLTLTGEEWDETAEIDLVGHIF